MKFRSNVTFILLSASLVATLAWLFAGDLFSRSLSSVGREHPLPFILWTVLVSTSFLVATATVGYNIGIRFKGFWGVLFYITTALSSTAKVISNSFIGEDATSMAVHLYFSLAFGISSLALVAFLLMVLFWKRRQKLYLVALLVHVSLSFGFLASIIIWDFLVFYQILMSSIGMATLLFLTWASSSRALYRQ